MRSTRNRPPPSWRPPVAAALCLVLGALALFMGALLTDGGRLLRPDTFADRAAASLSDDRVAAYVADRLTGAVLDQNRDLTAYRPLILTAARGVVTSDAFRGVARGTMRRAHSALFSGVGQSVVFSADDLDTLLRSALASTPELARALPDAVEMQDTAGLADHPAVRIARLAIQLHDALPRAGLLALLLGVVCLVAGGWLLHGLRTALVGAGSALIVTGLALWLLVPLGAGAITRLAPDPAAGNALAGLWSVALAGLRGWEVAFGATGVVLAAAGSSLLERLDVVEVGRRALRLTLTTPRRRSVRVARALGITAAGVIAAAAPGSVLNLLMVLTGIGLGFVGLRELFAVVLHAAPADVRVGRAVAANGEGWAVGVVLVSALTVLFASAIALTARPVIAARGPTSIAVCNGAATLCDRRLHEVVLAATHNSMASADRPDWLFPQQEHGIGTQLRDGIRALLIDVHYGTPAGDRVRTDLDDPNTVAQAERVLGPDGTAAAMRIRDRLVGSAEGRRGLYLCHGFCELGASPLDPTLREIREFMVRNPEEVLLVVVEDYVAPNELARAIEVSGLVDFVYHEPDGVDRGAPWPTLRELIARDERVVVLLESGRDDVSWLLPAFEVMQETPYAFTTTSDTLSCEPNRGGTTGSLFQVNHWITTTPAALPSNATVLNTRARLHERVRRCERERGLRVNVLAVDFYRTGDVLGVVEELNSRELGELIGPGA